MKKQIELISDKIVCDFCGRISKKVYTDIDRILCSQCLKVYLQSLRYKVLHLAGKVKLINHQHGKEKKRMKMRYYELQNYLTLEKEYVPSKSLQEKKRRLVENISQE